MRRISLAAVFLIASCASSGSFFTIDDANRVKNGMTREEVIAIMGSQPYRVTSQAESFTWSWAKADFLGGTTSRAVTFKFNKEGKTYDIPEAGVYGDIKKYQSTQQ